MIDRKDEFKPMLDEKQVRDEVMSRVADNSPQRQTLDVFGSEFADVKPIPQPQPSDEAGMPLPMESTVPVPEPPPQPRTIEGISESEIREIVEEKRREKTVTAFRASHPEIIVCPENAASFQMWFDISGKTINETTMQEAYQYLRAHNAVAVNDYEQGPTVIDPWLQGAPLPPRVAPQAPPPARVERPLQSGLPDRAPATEPSASPMNEESLNRMLDSMSPEQQRSYINGLLHAQAVARHDPIAMETERARQQALRDNR